MNPLPLETKEDLVRALNKAYDQIIHWKDTAEKYKDQLVKVKSIVRETGVPHSDQIHRLNRLLWPPKDTSHD